MKQITALRPGKGQTKRVRVSLDGKFAFSLEPEVVIQQDLEKGQALDETRIKELSRAGQFQRCLDTARRQLSYRPRSEAELRGRLRRQGYDDELREAVIVRLKEQGLVNDMAFTRFWVENRQTFSPRSQSLTRLELKKKGVARDVIDQIAGSIDDEDSAYQAARHRARRLPSLDYEGFRRRLFGYLKYRGFGIGVIRQAVARVWQERQKEAVKTEES